MVLKKIYLLFTPIFFLFLCSIYAESAEPIDHVTIAILAKDKAHTLPLYLSCIENQTWPKSKTYLYIRTNNNNDHTAQVLKEWVNAVQNSYAGIYFDDSDLTEEIQKYKQHEWNCVRFKILGKIRQDSVNWARAHNSHYFVVDCDNFIQPHTLEKLVETHMPIVAPLLTMTKPSPYSNYHAGIDQNGYCAHSPFYHPMLNLEICGLIQVPVVHCAYFIRYDMLDKIVYDDETYRYEYVIFSDNARKKNIPQYLDNREVYGRITFAENNEDLYKEVWLNEFMSSKGKMKQALVQFFEKADLAKKQQESLAKKEQESANLSQPQ